MNDLKFLTNLLVASQPLRQTTVPNLVVSLTTRGSRNDTLHLTLLSLLTQTFVPDAIEIFASKTVADQIKTNQLIKLNPKISVTATSDIGPHTKLIPAIKKHDSKYIVTVDDDSYYWPTWLEELVKISAQNPEAIVGHRAHQVIRNDDRSAKPYRDWKWNLRTTAGVEESDIFLTGVSGILYPPQPFEPKYLDEPLMQRLTPTADDIWFYFAALGSNRTRLITGSRMKVICWPETQSTALFTENIAGGNDKQFKACTLNLG